MSKKTALLSLYGVILSLLLTLSTIKETRQVQFEQDSLFNIYSTSLYSDLKFLLLSSIAKADHSLFLASYGFNDPDLINLLNAKADQKVSIKLLYDKKHPPRTNAKSIIKEKDTKSGLMHRKITLIDDEKIFLGSTNYTEPSFIMHENSLLYMEDKELAKHIENNLLYQTDNYTYYPLPEESAKALNHLVELIDNAKHSIDVFMYTFTHRLIAEKLIEAKNRGVQVRLVTDWVSSRGASHKICCLLSDAGIPIHSQLEKCLLHHKSAMIDNVMIIGSVNWTKSGFNKNREYMMVFDNLRGKDLEKAQIYFQELWHHSKKLRISKIPVKEKKWRIPYFPYRSLYSYLWTP